MSVSKRQLSYGYLAAIGVVFSGILLFSIVRAVGQADFATTGVLVTGLVPATSLASGHVWLARFRFSDNQLWRIATWCATGIGVFTLLTFTFVLLEFFHKPMGTSEILLLTSHVTLGGVAGVLVGTLWESLRTANRFRERNAVLNRVLRHNLRNDITVIQGRLTLLNRELNRGNRHRSVIEDKLDDILRVSEQSRALQQLIESDQDEPSPVDLVPIVEARVETLSDRYPEAEFVVSLPPSAPVLADDMIDTVILNLLENAVEHNDGDPKVRVTVTRQPPGTIEIQIADNGPGIPRYEHEVLLKGTETALRHGSGMGLWLVKWFVDRYNGELSFETSESGSLVTIHFARARPVRTGLCHLFETSPSD